MSIDLKHGHRLVWTWNIIGYDDLTPRVVRASDGGVVCTLRGHEDMIRGACGLNDGRVLTWSNDGTLRVWRVPDGACERIFDGHLGYVRGAFEWQQGRVVSHDSHHLVLAWDLATGHVVRRWPGREGDRSEVRTIDTVEPNSLLVQRCGALDLLVVDSDEPTWSLPLQSDAANVARVGDGHVAVFDEPFTVVEVFQLGRDTRVAVMPAFSRGTGLLGLSTGEILTHHWNRAEKRHTIHRWDAPVGRFLDSREVRGEDLCVFAEWPHGGVELSLRDYRRFAMEGDYMYPHEMTVLPATSGPFASFAPEGASARATFVARGTPALDARWKGAEDCNARWLDWGVEVTSARTSDGRAVLRRHDEWGLLNLESFQSEWLAEHELRAQHPTAYADVMAEGARTTLTWDAERSLAQLVRMDGSGAVLDTVTLEPADGEPLMGEVSFVTRPDGVVHAFDDARIAPLRDTRHGEPVALPRPGGRRRRTPWWCANNRIARHARGRIELIDSVTLQRVGTLDGGHGIAIRQFVELGDGTLVTRDSATLRSWHGQTLEPVVELCDPAEWGPEYGALVPLTFSPWLAFYAGQFSGTYHVTFWDGQRRVIVYGGCDWEVAGFRELGDGVYALQRADQRTHRWQVWRMPLT